MLLRKIARVIVRILLFFMFPITVTGRENVPASGGVILAINHKSNLDPVMMGVFCPYPERMTFMAKSELFKNKFFGALITKLGAFPIQRGRGDIGAMKAAFQILKKGDILMMFPEGGRVRDGKKRRAKPGVAAIATRAPAPVVPVHIKNGYRWMRRVTIVFGDPMDLTAEYGSKPTPEETQLLADKVLERIYEL